MIVRTGNLFAFFFFLVLAPGCRKEKVTSSLSAPETATLKSLLSAADSLALEGENYRVSDSLLRQAAPLLKRLGRSKTTYLAHRRQIMNLVFADQKKEALFLSDSLCKTFGVEDDSISGFYYGLSGWLYKETGDNLAAITSLEQAAARFEKHGPFDKLNGIYNNLGISYGQLGDHEKAIQNYESALRINVKNADTVEIANNHFNLALAFINLGDWSNAAKHNRSGAAFDQSQDGSFELQQADIARARGQTSSALRLVEQLKARVNLFDPENNARAGDNLFTMGQILLAADRPNEALFYLKKRLDCQTVIPLTTWERTKNHFLLGKAFLDQGKPAVALPYFQSALQSAVPSFKPANNLDNPAPDSLPPEVWTMETLSGKTAALDQIAAQKERARLPKEAISHLHAALETAEYAVSVIQKLKNNFVEDGSRLGLGEYTFQHFYEKPLDIAIRLADLTGNRSALEKAFLFARKSKAGVLRTALAEKRQLITAGVSEDSIRQLRELRLTTAAIQNSLKAVASDSLENALFQVKRNLYKFRQSLHLKPIPQVFDTDFSLIQLQNWLPDSSLLVEYFLGEQQLYIFSVSKTAFDVEKKPLSALFDTHIEGFQRSVSDWQWVADSSFYAETQYLHSATWLYDFLLKNALAKHPPTSRLFIVPDQKLARIPFPALLTQPFSGGWKDVDLPILIKKMAVSYRFSSAIPDHRKAGDKSPPRYGFGGFGTDYKAGMTLSSLQKSKNPLEQNLFLGLRGGPDALDFADDEVDSIAQLTGGQKWLNAQATKSNFLENVADCRILHISLHTVETDPRDPTGLAILFSKMSETDASLLTSSELYSLDLNTELAVVSSCQSGFGQFKQGEGTLSLGRAMALAGCHATVVNLWKADDRASRDLMISFYKNLKLGQAKDLALQNALLFYLKNTISERAGPQFWANFSAVGEMDPILFTEEKSSSWQWWLTGIGILGLLVLIIRSFVGQISKRRS